MTLAKVVRKGSYQGVAQWGISTSAEITPSRKTAQKWAELENAARIDRQDHTPYHCFECGKAHSIWIECGELALEEL